jgi:hypothetical protein
MVLCYPQCPSSPSPPPSVSDQFIVSTGGTLAVLAERLYLFDLLGGGLEDSRSVNGGLIVSEQIGKLHVIGRKLAFESNLTNGQIGKVFDLISDERIDSCTTVRVTSRLASGINLSTASSSANLDEQLFIQTAADKNLASSAFSASPSSSSAQYQKTNPKDIFLDDDITAATTDLYGKKMFIGTHAGKILLFDTTTIGILGHLTYNENETLSREGQGPVVTMKYCDAKELLVVAHASGVVKVFNGCHRNISAEQREKYLKKKNYTEWCPHYLGGNTPSSPLLFRSNQMVHESTVIAMAVSEELGLIALSGADGTGTVSCPT